MTIGCPSITHCAILVGIVQVGHSSENDFAFETVPKSSVVGVVAQADESEEYVRRRNSRVKMGKNEERRPGMDCREMRKNWLSAGCREHLGDVSCVSFPTRCQSPVGKSASGYLPNLPPCTSHSTTRSNVSGQAGLSCISLCTSFDETS